MPIETHPHALTGTSARAEITSRGRVATEAPRVSVLLIEDNPGDARLIQFMIQEAGSNLFQVEHVHRLSAGLERLASGGIGLVLSDLSLPDSQGLETFAQLHAKAPHVPIIVLSGLNDSSL